MRWDAFSRRDWLTIAGAGSLAAMPGLCSLAHSEEGSPAAKVTIPTVEKVRGSDPKLWKLVDLINDHRRRNALASIPLSPRMSVVAMFHARDLAHKKPHEKFGSLHSWSEGNARWKGGPFKAADKATWDTMWDKPKEIAAYPGSGYEVAAAQCKDLEQVLAAWLVSPAHSSVILNRGIWEKKKWQALGAAFEEGFACAWFGEEKDQG